ncbi:hypothetical protein O3P69_019139 [Scylla paramamosain]|uniref:Uncharacterized protein n=1 Tax=Scylla paramamosain TaxID=85552 RepID=A0AAW0SUI0_SCYPA
MVKETHRYLRERFKEEGDEAWKEHLGKEEELKKYAEAMQTLATQHWPAETEARSSRVGWVRAAVREYFYGGGLKAATDKEMRKIRTSWPHTGLSLLLLPT